MVDRSALMVLVALALIGVAFWGMSRDADGLHPDRGSGLPDGQRAAARRRLARSAPTRSSTQVTDIAKATPGVDDVFTISGVSVLDNNASLPSAGVRLRDAQGLVRARQGQGAGHPLAVRRRSRRSSREQVLEASDRRHSAAADPGHRQRRRLHDDGRVKDGSSDFAKLQNVDQPDRGRTPRSQSALQTVFTSFRATSPQLYLEVDRTKAETLGVTVGQVFTALENYVGSSYVTQFNKFGQVFQVYVQADAQFRMQPSDILNLKVQRRRARWCRLGTLVEIKHVEGPSLIRPLQSLSGRDDLRLAGEGLQLRPGHGADGADRRQDAAARHGLRLDRRCPIRRRSSAIRSTTCSRSRVLLVYFVLAGQYESWFQPLVGHPRRAAGAARHGRRAHRPRHRQQSLHPDRPHPADRARAARTPS